MRKVEKRSRSSEGRVPVPGISSPVEVRHHPTARRMTLRVSSTQRAVIVTLPRHCGTDAVAPFVARHIEWVRQHLGCLPEAVGFAAGAIVPLRGVAHRVEFAGPRPRGSPIVAVQPAQLPDELPRLVVSGDVEHAPRRLRDWLAGEAKRDLDERVTVHARSLGLTPKRIAVRDQVSRWGSCSTTGVLSFSWRLVLAPPHILDYVAAHEVAHLAEMNHGPRFWALCRRACPGMDPARAWLRKFGMELHRYDVSGQPA